MKFLRTRFALIVSALALIILAVIPACSYVPFDQPKPTSYFQVSTAQSNDLVRASNKLLEGRGQNESAFLFLIDGTDALGARLRMIEAAQETIDMQYFLIKPDDAGAIVSAALLKAADRGVRIRFLIDDIFTDVDDVEMAMLNAHENIEIRYFNPLSRRSVQPVAFMFGYPQTNRRMHNKSITADGSVAVLGGRNIADEYYNIGVTSTFADFDMLAAGQIVRDTGAQFDVYWNDVFAVPVERLKAVDPDKVADLRLQLRKRAEQGALGEYKTAINSTYIGDIIGGVYGPYISEARVVYDSPDKLRNKIGDGPYRLAEELLAEMSKAKREVTLITPYFVPQEWGTDFFLSLEKRGINVRIVTNSLAANNHAYVHGGYIKYRQELQEGGVEFFEVKHFVESNDDDAMAETSPLTMHSKIATIDDDTLFFGSLNFDPRSILVNTEFGVFVRSPQMAKLVNDNFEASFDKFTYRLALDQNGETVFLDRSGDQETAIYGEPQATFIAKTVAWITQFLPVEKQL